MNRFAIKNELPKYLFFTNYSSILLSLFKDLTGFLDLDNQIHACGNQIRKAIPLKIIDSTTLPLNLTNYKWARFRKTKAGVKLHLRLVYMGKDNVYPDKAIMTPTIEHDRNQFEVLVDDKKTMYVLDRGYVDYERFNGMTDDSYFFVSRLKKNAVTGVADSFELPSDSSAICDDMVYIGTTQNRAENIYRLVEVNDTKGNILCLITSGFDLSADEISDIYRSRGAIELFFKGLKVACRNQTFLWYDGECIAKSNLYYFDYLLSSYISQIRSQ